MQLCYSINRCSDEISNLRRNTHTLGVRNRPPIQSRMKQYIVYAMLGMSFSYMVTGDLDRMGRGAEIKTAFIRNPLLASSPLGT